MENIRQVTKNFGLIFFIEILILGFILYLSYFTIENASDKIIHTGSILASFIIVFLTTALVYSNFLQRSEMKLMNFLIVPVHSNNDTGNMETVVKNDFLELGTGQVRSDVYSIKFPLYIKKVECQVMPTFLQVRNTITNLGLFTANINEIRYYRTYPKHARPTIDGENICLSHQNIHQILKYFPDSSGIWNFPLKGGKYVLKFEAVGVTGKIAKQVWIDISNDLETIKWSESKLLILLTKIFKI